MAEAHGAGKMQLGGRLRKITHFGDTYVNRFLVAVFSLTFFADLLEFANLRKFVFSSGVTCSGCAFLGHPPQFPGFGRVTPG
jgi:hypothetical protein